MRKLRTKSVTSYWIFTQTWLHKKLCGVGNRSDEFDKRSSKNLSRTSIKNFDPNLQHFLVNNSTNRRCANVRSKVFNSKSARSEILNNRTWLAKKYIDIEFENHNSRNMINDTSVMHHCSQLSNEKFGRTRKNCRPSMMSKDTTSSTSPRLRMNSTAKQKYLNHLSKENMNVTSLYSKVKERISDIGLHIDRFNMFHEVNQKMNSRDLPPMTLTHNEIESGKSRNNRYDYLLSIFSKFKLSKISPDRSRLSDNNIDNARKQSNNSLNSKVLTKGIPQSSVTFQGRVMKHKTLNDLRNKQIKRNVFAELPTTHSHDNLGNKDRLVTISNALKEQDLNIRTKHKTNDLKYINGGNSNTINLI